MLPEITLPPILFILERFEDWRFVARQGKSGIRLHDRGSDMRVGMCCVMLAMLACTNEAALAANPDNGSTLAQRWCTGCHVVSGDQTKGTDIAPSFASIAKKPDFNVEKLASFLLEPHPKMPNMALSPEETKDIGAYIAAQSR
jgi:mono/diheme cytochrome c family protein